MLCISLRMKIARDGLLCVMRFPRYLTVPGRLICLQLVASGKKWLTAFLQQRRGAFRVGWICKYQMFVRILKPFLDPRIPKKALEKEQRISITSLLFLSQDYGPIFVHFTSCTRTSTSTFRKHRWFVCLMSGRRERWHGIREDCTML